MFMRYRGGGVGHKSIRKAIQKFCDDRWPEELKTERDNTEDDSPAQREDANNEEEKRNQKRKRKGLKTRMTRRRTRLMRQALTRTRMTTGIRTCENLIQSCVATYYNVLQSFRTTFDGLRRIPRWGCDSLYNVATSC